MITAASKGVLSVEGMKTIQVKNIEELIAKT